MSTRPPRSADRDTNGDGNDRRDRPDRRLHRVGAVLAAIATVVSLAAVNSAGVGASTQSDATTQVAPAAD